MCDMSQAICLRSLTLLSCKMGPARVATEHAPGSRPGWVAEKGLCRIIEFGVGGPIYRGETEAPGRAPVGLST